MIYDTAKLHAVQNKLAALKSMMNIVVDGREADTTEIEIKNSDDMADYVCGVLKSNSQMTKLLISVSLLAGDIGEYYDQIFQDEHNKQATTAAKKTTEDNMIAQLLQIASTVHASNHGTIGELSSKSTKQFGHIMTLYFLRHTELVLKPRIKAGGQRTINPPKKCEIDGNTVIAEIGTVNTEPPYWSSTGVQWVVKVLYEIRKPVFIFLDQIFKTTATKQYQWWESYDYYTIYDMKRSQNVNKSDHKHSIPVKFKTQKMLRIEITTPYSLVNGVKLDYKHNTLNK
jgi:hypothetical protein